MRATPLLGGATHFASFYEALAEQSARISLVQAQTRPRLIMILALTNRANAPYMDLYILANKLWFVNTFFEK